MKFWQLIIYGSLMLVCLRILFLRQFSGSNSTFSKGQTPTLLAEANRLSLSHGAASSTNQIASKASKLVNGFNEEEQKISDKHVTPSSMLLPAIDFEQPLLSQTASSASERMAMTKKDETAHQKFQSIRKSALSKSSSPSSSSASSLRRTPLPPSPPLLNIYGESSQQLDSGGGGDDTIGFSTTSAKKMRMKMIDTTPLPISEPFIKKQSVFSRISNKNEAAKCETEKVSQEVNIYIYVHIYAAHEIVFVFLQFDSLPRIFRVCCTYVLNKHT
jgi:hypothetical protein